MDQKRLWPSMVVSLVGSLMGSIQCTLLCITVVINGQERVCICICYLHRLYGLVFHVLNLQDQFFYHNLKLHTPRFLTVLSLSHWQPTKPLGHDPWERLRGWTVGMWNRLIRVAMPLCIECPFWRKEGKKARERERAYCPTGGKSR